MKANKTEVYKEVKYIAGRKILCRLFQKGSNYEWSIYDEHYPYKDGFTGCYSGKLALYMFINDFIDLNKNVINDFRKRLHLSEDTFRSVAKDKIFCYNQRLKLKEGKQLNLFTNESYKSTKKSNYPGDYHRNRDYLQRYSRYVLHAGAKRIEK
ncbi:hypothetical protein [Peromfec virus RodF8_19]|uniref:Uncharacterized protein n=1 Tax=Peromfec virus RodF8_19 TaxID=2929361 RepID=A0A976N1Y0_9VIRU|nr:hypothetical protein [Peromfec virus RodF8_19]